MPLDYNDGAALRVAPVKGLDAKLGNEFCPRVSPSQVRDACGPHDGNEQIGRASELQSQSNIVCRLLLEKKNAEVRCRTVPTGALIVAVEAERLPIHTR